MSDPLPSSFAEELLKAPAGVALVARLEAEQRPDLPWHGWPGDCDPAAVRRAVHHVATMPFGEFLATAVSSAERLAGPWSGEALLALPHLYEHAHQRREIAEAIAEGFSERLHRSADRDAQQWWHEERRAVGHTAAPCFTDYSKVYGNGEFTWSGLWTVTDPPFEVHDALISAWDFSGGPVSRWLLPVRAGARLWTIDRPADWTRLVETYPKVATRSHAGWELPGPNQHRSDTQALQSIVGQHAVRTEIDTQVLPDWQRVANDFDGVHLSWAGFLTTEGYISDLSGEGVTMLRYWASERTLWLHDLFEEPELLGIASPLGGRDEGTVFDADSKGAVGRPDPSFLRTFLGR